jgi:hypothetical protein
LCVCTTGLNDHLLVCAHPCCCKQIYFRQSPSRKQSRIPWAPVSMPLRLHISGLHLQGRPHLPFRYRGPAIRFLNTTRIAQNIPTWPSPPMPQNPVGPSAPVPSSSTSDSPYTTAAQSFWRAWSSSASFQAALTTIVGLGMVFGAGVGYLEWYKAHVLHRVCRPVWPDPSRANIISDGEGLPSGICMLPK